MARVFTVDTLQLSKRLREAGLKKETAEVLAEEFREIGEQSVEGLAKEQSLNDLKKEMIQENKLIRQEIRNAMLTTILGLGAIIALVEKFIN